MNKSLPAWPYKGLSYYRATDARIFGGRDGDVGRVARRLGRDKTRVLLLHGRTGCGKSSFLRAGLIPFLEQAEHGFRFLREPGHGLFEAGEGPALFLRATGSPLLQVGLALYVLCQKPVQMRTPGGPRQIDLRGVLGRRRDWGGFIRRIDDGNGDELVQTLRRVGNLLPITLAIILDQGEEVFTQGGPARSRQFCEFLGEFCRLSMDLKLLISLRTEFYGTFVDEISQVLPARTGMEEEMLRELGAEQIATAIEYPTKIENAYNFEYDEGVAGHIAGDLMAAPTRGGKLPVMQIVCGRLYKDAKSRMKGDETATIGLADYERLGGVRQQVMEHVNGVLRVLCQKEGMWMGVEEEVRRWYRVLEELVTVQGDGTVTTNQRTENELQGRVKGARVSGGVRSSGGVSVS